MIMNKNVSAVIARVGEIITGMVKKRKNKRCKHNDKSK